MEKLITLAVFDNVYDVKFNLLKDMLEEAGIPYLSTNENSRAVKPMPFRNPVNVAIDIKVYEKDAEAALEIFNSIT